MKRKKKKHLIVSTLAVMLTLGLTVPVLGTVNGRVLARETEILTMQDLDQLAEEEAEQPVLAASTIPSGSVSRVVQAALGQVGYTEQANEYTQFGKWYGLPNAYWCDMFVSWCANQAGVSQSVFPKSASCTAHVGQFKQMARFFPSTSRGGTYAPQPGDLLFFYNPVRYPQGTVSGHVGLVLYTENGYVYTIEGNTLANRVDCLDRFLLDSSTSSYEPADYVSVNFYPLNDRRILGYGSPNYASRTAPVHKGYVDLGPYADRADLFTQLDQTGLLPATSSHTYSPRHGLTRGDFLLALTKLYGLKNSDSQTAAYRDVPSDSPYYDAVMAARSCGIIGQESENQCSPQAYISASDAQAMISRTLSYVGQPNQTFSFSRGDYPAYGEYTIRADLATALAALSKDASPSVTYRVSFDANQASGRVPSPAVSAYNRVTLPSADTLNREGYRFMGWKSSENQKIYAPGKTVPLTSHTTFTAQWQVENAPITTPSLLLDRANVEVNRGGTAHFLVKETANAAEIAVHSTDPSIATVAMSDATNSNGITYTVTGTGVGTTDIRVTVKGQTTVLKVTVAASKGSITLDTANYIMAPGNIYDIGAVIQDPSGQKLDQTQIRELVKEGTLKVTDSRTGSVASLEQLENGNFRVTGKQEGTTYIVYDIGGTHASIRIDVQKGVKQHGTAVRNTSYFTK